MFTFVETDLNRYRFIEISRRQDHEHSPSRTFIKLFTFTYKRQGKADD